MKNRFTQSISFFLVFAISTPILGMGVGERETHAAYVQNLGSQALHIGLSAGPEHIIPNLAESTAIDLTHRSVSRLCNFTQRHQKILLSWAIGFLCSGIKSYSNSKKQGIKYTNGWFTNFTFNKFLPNFMQSLTVDLVYSTVARIIPFQLPAFINNYWLLGWLASELKYEISYFSKGLLHTFYTMLLNKDTQ